MAYVKKKHDKMDDIEFSEQLAGAIDSLKAYSNRLSITGDFVDDLMQETLLKAMMCKKYYRRDANFVGWLSVIMRNSYLNMVKREKCYVAEDRADADSGEYCDFSLEYRELLALIATLPEDLRLVFKLYVVGYKYCEIAEMLSLPLGTVKSRIHAARKWLRDFWSGIMGFNAYFEGYYLCCFCKDVIFAVNREYRRHSLQNIKANFVFDSSKFDFTRWK